MILNKLFFSKKKILQNRISVSSMCQYSAKDGCPSDWHYRHLSNLLISGAGLLMLESTAVESKGRITHNDLCIETLHQKNEMKKLISYLKKINNTPIGIQISHSGRKGSSYVPWIKPNSPLIGPESWQTVSSSNLRKDIKWPEPKIMSLKDIKRIQKKFENSIKNSLDANFDLVEIHMAHGYLIHQFLSPICNNRNDAYGGSILKRFKFALEIAKIARRVLPKNKILGARITGNDHLKDGISPEEAIKLSSELKKLDLIIFVLALEA